MKSLISVAVISVFTMISVPLLVTLWHYAPDPAWLFRIAVIGAAIFFCLACGLIVWVVNQIIDTMTRMDQTRFRQ